METNDRLGMKPSRIERQKRRNKRMDKMLTECYRLGTRQKKQKGYNKVVARGHARNKEGIRFMGGNTKYFNDDLAYLKRFLDRNVGKNWNKVYAKLSEQFDKNSATGLHVFQHLLDYVCLDAVFENGKPYLPTHKRSSWHERTHYALYSTENTPRFYVHPKTGQLMKAMLLSTKKLRATFQIEWKKREAARLETQEARAEQERSEMARHNAIKRIQRLQEAHLAHGGYYNER